jgi:hypothetical protein
LIRNDGATPIKNHYYLDEKLLQTYDRNISTKKLSLGKPIPDDFTISDEIKQWFGEQKNVYNLEAHFKYFVSQAKAKGYRCVDWDEYLKNAILQNWARVEPPAGMALMRGVTYAK